MTFPDFLKEWDAKIQASREVLATIHPRIAARAEVKRYQERKAAASRLLTELRNLYLTLPGQQQPAVRAVLSSLASIPTIPPSSCFEGAYEEDQCKS